MRPTEETKKFWLMLYAMDAFKKCIHCCDSLLEGGIAPSDFDYLPMIVAILTMYGKPFHRNVGVGKLDDIFVPEAYKDLHQLMIRDRDKIHAHSDAKGITTNIGNANQIRLIRNEKGFMWSVPTSVSYGKAEIENVIALCKALIRKLDYYTTKYEKKVLKEIKKLPPGEYVLNFDLNDSSIFTRVKEVGLSRDIHKWNRLD
jgi:hypothetical protein